MANDISSEPKPGSPSFFKVVRYPSAPHLPLPIAFVRMYFKKIPKYPTLKTATGEHSWRLKIKKIGEDYCFTHGWEKLAQDVQLCIRDILVFWLIDSSTFQVSFFDEHGCEKDLPLSNTSWVFRFISLHKHKLNWVLTDGSRFSGDGDEDDDEDDVITPEEDLYFQKVICSRNHKYYMGLPKKFVDAAGIKNKSSIQMKDKEGKEWKIGLRTEIYANTRMYLSSGWPHFREYHDLCEGDMCLFKYIKEEGVLILAELIKSKRPAKQETLGAKVKVGYESGPEAEVLKKKRGMPLVEKHCGGGGGVEVKIEDEEWPEVEVVKKKRGTPPLEEPHGGGGVGGGVKVKIEDESCPMEVERVKENMGGPLVVKAYGGGVGEVKTGPETERLVRYRQVIYF